MSSNNPKLQKVLQDLNSLDQSSFEHDGDRVQALLGAYDLVSRLESPWEFVMRHVMTQPATGAAIKICKDLQLLEKWDAAGNPEMASEDLAAMVNCDPEFLCKFQSPAGLLGHSRRPSSSLTIAARFLRHLANVHVLAQPSPNIFVPDRIGTALLKPAFSAWFDWLYDSIIPGYLALPSFAQKTGYQSSSVEDAYNGVFQAGLNCPGVGYFKYFDNHPREQKTFDMGMTAVKENQATWLEIFPADELVKGAVQDETAPLVVDIAGGLGQDVESFRAKYPELAGRLYLLDMKDVVSRSICPDPVRKVEYDFFTPQTVKEARVYYLHAILHDWPDHDAKKILEMQRDALKPGYSTLLIHDMVVPEAVGHPHVTAYDLLMMVLVGGKERTEQRWTNLLDSAGYSIVRIWKSPSAAQSIIEAKLKD